MAIMYTSQVSGEEIETESLGKVSLVTQPKSQFFNSDSIAPKPTFLSYISIDPQVVFSMYNLNCYQ